MIMRENKQMNRKQRRKISKKNRKVEEQISLFQNLPDYCLVCESDFDKKDREMVSSWNVVVKEEKVRLYCPDCWNNALKLLEEIKEEFSKND